MRISSYLAVLIFALVSSPETGFADGKVFAQPDVLAKVEIPNQQALIYHGDGVECLVIETSFLGEGTSFGWVVPLPSEPKVQPVSESFFPESQQACQPRLLHYVHHYYLGILFVCGLAFLAWRSLKDEVVWIMDLPLCLLLAVGIGLLGKSVILGMLVLAFTLGTRLIIRSTTSFTVVVLIGMLLAVWVTAALNLERFGLVQTLGSDSDSANTPRAEVAVLSVQHAGVFDSTTIRGANPRAILSWLESNGFAATKSMESVVRDYVEQGWVFVASKVRRENAASAITSLHPLAFTFATTKTVYPLRLTGVDNGDCTVDLYVFGSQRARASHFHSIRCDRVANNMPDEPGKSWESWLLLRSPEVLNCISNATVGTKLSAVLTPQQMKVDAEISWQRFSTKAATVYSHAGAAIVALNVAVPLAVLCWLLIGTSRGSWGVDEKFIARWRQWAILGALVVGLGIFWLLPKVDIITTPPTTGISPSATHIDYVTAVRNNLLPDNCRPLAWRSA